MKKYFIMKKFQKRRALSLSATIRCILFLTVSNNFGWKRDHFSGNFLDTVSSAPSLAPLLELETWSGRLPWRKNIRTSSYRQLGHLLFISCHRQEVSRQWKFFRQSVDFEWKVWGEGGQIRSRSSAIFGDKVFENQSSLQANLIVSVSSYCKLDGAAGWKVFKPFFLLD